MIYHYYYYYYYDDNDYYYYYHYHNRDQFYFFFLLFTTVLSQLDFSHAKYRLPSPGKASCDRVALPNLRCMLGVLLFP